MTTNNLVTKIRTLLDEASAGFYEDEEIHRAIGDGQNTLIKLHLSVWKTKIKVNQDEELPETLRVLITQTTGTTTSNLPDDFLEYVSVYSTDKTIYVRNQSRVRSALKNNSILASSASQIFCSFNSTQIVFETDVSWTMDYLAKPDQISGTVDPVLPDTCEDALINYAFSEMLRSDNQANLAAEAFNRFIGSVQAIY